MRERSQVPDPAIDREEETWWNDNADVVEAIWAMAEPVRQAIRAPYLERARRFFLEGKNGSAALLLEVGCGSGWVGRMIADRQRLRIIGLDIASEQIRLAKENAASAGLGDVCEYRCQNLADFTVSDAKSVSCVLMHAILHHLSWQEIRSVLHQLRALGPGTRIFIYEPVYLADPDDPPAPETAEARRARKLAEWPQRACGWFSRIFRPSRDRALVKKVETLAKTAQAQGRILSPKEVVFREPEILSALGEIGEVTERYLCDFTSMPTAQYGTTLRNPTLQRLFGATVVPLARRIDAALFRRGQIPLVTRQYVFMGYHCVVR
jgi:2-polyprenyl-3-methyl-5-hydroxy-6-metoxy-1,4-benzoquinol methylase